jgi:hypothetical protein
MEQNDLSVWADGAPVADMDSTGDFTNWLDGAPVVEIGASEGGGETQRRRCFIF